MTIKIYSRFDSSKVVFEYAGDSLIGANLRGANLRGADLSYANLRGADLSGADLSNADLYSADLSYANLSDANLRGANLSRADLSYANLSDVYLSGADLSGANLSNADLYSANLRGATLPYGETWEQYLSDVVPSLLMAGGKSVREIIDAGAWDCHSWDNCPMHAAFGITRAEDGPRLLVPRIQEFVQLFDAGLIPKPQV